MADCGLRYGWSCRAKREGLPESGPSGPPVSSCSAALAGSASCRADLAEQREQIEIMCIELDRFALDLNHRAGRHLN